eukprot:s1364_g8.t1
MATAAVSSFLKLCLADMRSQATEEVLMTFPSPRIGPRRSRVPGRAWVTKVHRKTQMAWPLRCETLVAAPMESLQNILTAN